MSVPVVVGAKRILTPPKVLRHKSRDFDSDKVLLTLFPQ